MGWVRLLGMSPVCDSEKTVCCGKSPINSTRNFNIFSFACSPRVHKGFPPLITLTEKHAKRTEQYCQTINDTHRSRRPRALRRRPLLLEDPGGGTIRDGLKAEQKFT